MRCFSSPGALPRQTWVPVFDHGRVAPFGMRRITRSQPFPCAFRGVGASFIGLSRLGIHHVPISGSCPSGSRTGSWLRGARGNAQRSPATGTPQGAAPLVVKVRCARGRRWSRGDSNPGPPPCKGGALPAKLRPPDQPALPPVVGAPGLEPGTSALSGPRSNQLSYAPGSHRYTPRAQHPGAVPKTKQRPPGPATSRPLPRPTAPLPTTPRRGVPPVRWCVARSPPRAFLDAGLTWAVAVHHGPPFPRKEVIQPQLPLRLPCYDFVPITSPTLDGCAPHAGSPTGFRCCRLS
jgi:hypothetical protein